MRTKFDRSTRIAPRQDLVVRFLSRGVARRRHIASADISYSNFISKRSFSGDFDDAFRNVMFSLSAE